MEPLNSMKNNIQLFQNQGVRTAWDADSEEWLFAVVDVVRVLTDQPDQESAGNYWRVLKSRLKKEIGQTITKRNGLKMLAEDGKMRVTDVATTQELLRIIQSIPSKKAEPFKQWLAEVGNDRINELQNPELALNILAETSATELSKTIDAKGLSMQSDIAKRSGKIAGDARKNIEQQTGRSVVSPQNANDLRLDSGEGSGDGKTEN